MHSTDWTDLRILVPVSELEAAAAAALMVSNSGLYIEDYSDLEEQVQAIVGIDLIDDSLREKDRGTAIIHLYLPPDESHDEAKEKLRHVLFDAGIRFSFKVSEVKETDWENAWKDYYHPFELSSRLAVCPSWETYEPKPGQAIIRLDPAMAFGTGTHETTRLCLSLIELFLKPGHRVLDIGCGSGILAIAAAMLGAKEVVGVDNDPIAVRTSRENAAKNDLSIEFIQGDLNADLPGPFDVVCANIVADVIIRLAAKIPSLLAPNGVCIFSGIVVERYGDVLQALLSAGLMPGITRQTGGWIAICCRSCPTNSKENSYAEFFC